jgi:hypothetical protein
MGLKLARAGAKAWPIPVSSGENILAEQYNILLTGVQSWQGPVNGNGFALSNAILPPATASIVGGIKPGAGVAVAADGTLSVNAGATRAVTTNSQLLNTDYYVSCSGSVTSLTMPATPIVGQSLVINNATAGVVVLTAQSGGNMIDFSGVGHAVSPTTSIGIDATIALQWDGALWRMINSALQQPGINGYRGILQPASATALGGVKQGSNISIAADGTISAATAGVIAGAIRSVTVNTTLASTDYIVIATAASITLTLPTAPTTGQIYYCKNGNATSGQLVTVASGSTIDGAASRQLDAQASLLAVYDGTMYRIL